MDGTQFVFPNDAHPAWSVMIVLYPYITGLVAGAFVVSALYHVFNRRRVEASGTTGAGHVVVFLCVRHAAIVAAFAPSGTLFPGYDYPQRDIGHCRVRFHLQHVHACPCGGSVARLSTVDR